jgi:hypothetical protein
VRAEPPPSFLLIEVGRARGPLAWRLGLLATAAALLSANAALGLLLGAVAALLLVTELLQPSGEHRKGRVASVSGGELHVDDRLVLRRDDATHVEVEPSAIEGMTLVRFRRRRARSLRYRVTDDATAYRLLDLLGLASPPPPAQFRVAPRLQGVLDLPEVLTWAVTIALALGFLASLGGAGLLLAWGLPFVQMGMRRLLSGSVVVGLEGIVVKSPGLRRVVSYAEVDGIVREGDRVHVELREGGRVELARVKSGDEHELREIDALERRLVDAFASYEASRSSAAREVERLVAPRGKGADDWLAALVALGDARGGYRDVSIPRDVLWMVVEGGATAPLPRVGAAVALLGDLDAAGRDRLVRVAAGCAEPALGRLVADVARAETHEALRGALERALALPALGAPSSSVSAVTRASAELDQGAGSEPEREGAPEREAESALEAEREAELDALTSVEGLRRGRARMP